MIEEILDFIHNYFVKEKFEGEFKIKSGSLSVDFLLNGQYFKIVGSVLNDGVYKYPEDTLVDEDFEGEVWALAIPASFMSLANEIDAWQVKYGEESQNLYQSESFGGYSYTKASPSGNSKSAQLTWRDVFGSRLNAYRKIS